MKKYLIILLFLLIPVVSFAGDEYPFANKSTFVADFSQTFTYPAGGTLDCDGISPSATIWSVFVVDSDGHFYSSGFVPYGDEITFNPSVVYLDPDYVTPLVLPQDLLQYQPLIICRGVVDDVVESDYVDFRAFAFTNGSSGSSTTTPSEFSFNLNPPGDYVNSLVAQTIGFYFLSFMFFVCIMCLMIFIFRRYLF